MGFNKKLWMAGWILGLCFLVFIAAGTTPALAKQQVLVFHAGSLTVPFAEVEKQFEAAHPEIDVLREAGGSTMLARMITEIGKPADIMASADYKVIDKNLIPAHADWNILFASNQLVLCYTDQSKSAAEISADNWYEILARPGIVWGQSDPNLDPCGYRALMVIQLAEKFHNKPGLYDQLIANRPQANVRPKSIELVSLLKTAHMDYAWEYQSVALQHNLKYIALDDHINLGNYRFDPFYAHAQVKVTGKKPGSWVTQTGQSSTYGITLMKNAPHRKEAILFLEYLLDPAGGLKILQKNGQPIISPSQVGSAEIQKTLPGKLSDLVEVTK